MSHLRQRAGNPNDEQQARYDLLTEMMAKIKPAFRDGSPLAFTLMAFTMNQAAECINRKNLKLADIKIGQVRKWMELIP